MYYGYHRVSTTEQKLDRGVTVIESFCRERGYPLEKVFVDKMSGKSFDRPRYIVLKEDVLRDGDTLILSELDRMGRNKSQIADDVLYFQSKGVRLMFLDIPTTTIDYSSISDEMSRLALETANRVLIEIYAMNAEAELDRNKKRCDEGREAMKARGEWDKYGRPRVMKKEAFAKHYTRVVNKEIDSIALMRELGLSRDTYFRYIREYRGLLNITTSQNTL